MLRFCFSARPRRGHLPAQNQRGPAVARRVPPADFKSQISNLKSQIPNSKSPISNLKFQVPADFKFQISNLESQIPNPKFPIRLRRTAGRSPRTDHQGRPRRERKIAAARSRRCRPLPALCFLPPCRYRPGAVAGAVVYALEILRAAEGTLPPLGELEKRASERTESLLGWPA